MRYYPHFILPMCSSRGFRVYDQQLIRPFQTRFRFGSAARSGLTLLLTVSRRIIMQKAHRQAFLLTRHSPSDRLLRACGFRFTITPP